MATATFLVRAGVGIGPSVSILARHICDGAQWAVATAAATRWVLGWVLVLFSCVASVVSGCLRRRAVCCWFFLWGFLCLGGVLLGDEGDRADSMQRAEATATVTGCMLWGILLAVAFPLSLAALLGHGHGSIRPTAAAPTVLVYAVVGWFSFCLSALATHRQQYAVGSGYRHCDGLCTGAGALPLCLSSSVCGAVEWTVAAVPLWCCVPLWALAVFLGFCWGCFCAGGWWCSEE